MSVKKSKLDLLVRVRYSNPLPAPPCPPKLLQISTNPMRYTKPEFINAVADYTPLPMIVDAECGMPLDLAKFACLWEEGVDDSELNPDPKHRPQLDPEDQFLLGDPNATSMPTSSSMPSTPHAAHVTWLRKTEYLSREGVSKASLSQEAKLPDAPIDISRAAQIRDIEASFMSSNEAFDLTKLRHPNKPNVTAVDSYEILPDADIWANAYDLFRFSERPGERPVDVDDPRLNCAILRPMESDGDHFLAYYLTKDDDSAIEFTRARNERYGTVIEEEEPTAFHFVRDYEVVKVEQEVPNEFLLVIDEGDTQVPPDDDGESKLGRRAKGAYYKNIERKMILKKKRQNIHEAYLDKWHVVKVSHVPMSKEEEDERDETMAEVMDPMYLLPRGDADAEGEVDDTMVDPAGLPSSHAEGESIDITGIP
ncbi:RNA polymerase II-associated protein [Gloeophyllum trabeum ATCC 11539]|uniref:RNA polymerase II-associated protein n=1 Tax=Gloeophyllum trabeum (strain ATCC 11539 / FP-39264 / Madison 617) TaxID=670483 RepID=S7QB95_GLOTA|nr:RNA polymerase II-associated protein [Gloeophyllum trabeum ATCC 11539]EPQ56608.1 RNA polymerase II-associated protein [Gloeophyllum trabeum ATCC 11539]